MTLQDIWAAVSVELGVRADVAGEKQTQVTRLANSAVLEILKRTKVRVTSSPLQTSVGIGDYDLPSEILRLTALLAPSSGYDSPGPLPQIAPEELDWRRRANAASSSDPALAYAVDGFNLLKLYPTPTVVYNLTAYYVPRPAKMSAAGNDPATVTYGGIPEEFHEQTLLPFIYMKMGSAGDDNSSAQGARYGQAFEEGIKELRKRINRRKGRLGPARTAYTRRRLASRNDVA